MNGISALLIKLDSISLLFSLSCKLQTNKRDSCGLKEKTPESYPCPSAMDEDT